MPRRCEVYRVLVPEGRTVISGWNPWSLWGLRQGARPYQRLGGGSHTCPMGEFISPGRLRDWLRLLGFELETISFGCYRGLRRPRSAGCSGMPGWRAWCTLVADTGAGYAIVAAKRVPGMRLLEPSWRKALNGRRAGAGGAPGTDHG